jgi:lysophospholipase L1-like esterase
VPASAPVAASAAPAALKTVHILFEGDSTMYGSDVMSCHNPNCQNYDNEPDVTASLLNDKNGLGPGSVAILNAAVPSTFLAQMLPGNNAQYPYSFIAVLENVPSKIVVSNHAINDSSTETPEQYASYLNQYIDDVLAAGKIPVLDEPNPVCDNKRPKLDQYVSILRTVAAQRNILLIPQYDSFKAIPNWETLLPDCVHPSTNGYAVKARNTAQALIPLIQKIKSL